MTNHWVDIKNADLVLIMGGNAAEAHPCGFKWVIEAKQHRKAKLVGNDGSGLQGPCVGAADQPPDLALSAVTQLDQRIRRRFRLTHPFIRQHRIGDARIDAGHRKNSVKLGLAVADQEHKKSGIRLAKAAGRPYFIE